MPGQVGCDVCYDTPQESKDKGKQELSHGIWDELKKEKEQQREQKPEAPAKANQNSGILEFTTSDLYGSDISAQANPKAIDSSPVTRNTDPRAVETDTILVDRGTITKTDSSVAINDNPITRNTNPVAVQTDSIVVHNGSITHNDDPTGFAPENFYPKGFAPENVDINKDSSSDTKSKHKETIGYAVM